MACLKKLSYIFIPVLAVLLMSHNTFAMGNMFTPVTCYHDTGGGNQCINYALTTGNTLDIISVSRENNPTLNSITNGEHFLWALSVRSYGNTPINLSINLANGYPAMASVDDIEQYCTVVNNITTCNILVHGYLLRDLWNIQLAGEITGFGSIYTIDSIYFSADLGSDVQIINRLKQIRDILQNNPTPTAQEIADAVNQPTQDAVNNIENQTTVDYEMQSANMSSLFSQFGGFITAVQGASIGDCNIPANLNHLNLGILDMCANPVPDYAQVAVSIIVCMLIAPYLLNIIKRIIGIADKVREV